MPYATLTSLVDNCLQFLENRAIRYVSNNKEINLTYREFFALSESVAEYLIDLLDSKVLGVNCFVGVCCDVSFSYPCIIYGILKAGLAFVPLDPLNGILWNDQIIQKLKIKLIIMNQKDHFSDSMLLRSIKICHESIDFRISDVIKNDFNGQSMAYSVQTSGTTGSPKVIRVPHAAIIPNILDLSDMFEMTSTDVIYLSSAPTFDPSVVEMFLAFHNGATLLILDRCLEKDSENFSSSLFSDDSNGVTVLQTTPSKFVKLSTKVGLDRIFGKNSNLRVLAFGGEKCPTSETLKKWNIPVSVSVYNLYGISEVSCWAAVTRVLIHNENNSLNETEGVPEEDVTEFFTTPLTNTLLEVRNTNELNIGEMFIGSRTRVCLIDNENWETLKDSFIFRPTGDLFQVNKNKYFFISRKKDEIKRFGIKMNLKCLQVLAEEDPRVDRAVCVSCENDISTLVGLLVVPKENGDFTLEDFKARLRKKSAQGCWPDRIEVASSIPITKHGKIDEKAICTLMFNKKSVDNIATLFKTLWSNFTVAEVDDKKGFISSGGTSFLAVQFISELQRFADVNYDFVSNLVQDVKYEDCLKLLEPFKIISKGKNFKVNSRERLDSDCQLEVRKGLEFVIDWRYDLEKCVDASPICGIVDGVSYVIIGSHSGKVAVLKVDDGCLLSEVCLPDRVESTACIDLSRKQFAIGCYDYSIYMFTLESKLVWSFKTEDIVKSSPVVFEDLLICGSYDKYVYCLNCADGQLIWKQQVNGQVLTRVQIIDSFVIVATLGGCVKALRLTDGTLVWTFNTNGPVFSNFIITEEKIGIFAGVQGTLFWVSISTGQQMVEFITSGIIFSSLIMHEDCILFGTTEGWLYNINRQEVSIIWKKRLDSRIVSSPLVVKLGDLLKKSSPSERSLDGDMIVVIVATSKGNVYLIDFDDGTPITSIGLQGEVFSSPACQSSSIIIGCRDNNVYSLKLRRRIRQEVDSV